MLRPRTRRPATMRAVGPEPAERAASGGASGGGGREGGIGAVRGCCKPNGMCGVLINFPGLELGCVEIPEVDGGPAPQACTPSGS